jgi:nickel/cobalt exporter
MDALATNLVLAAAVLGVVHTALGADHTLPFVMLGRARGWTVRRTLAVTAACGVGHVASSLALGLVGLSLGWGMGRIEAVDATRGSLAAWALVLFGGAYALWGVRRALRRGGGLVLHAHDGTVHLHRGGGHGHGHVPGASPSGASFWVLFLVFVLGPCEPLIPLFALPASVGEWRVALLAGAVFAAATLGTMLTLVGLAAAGAARLPLGPLERWSHALAGGVIAASGAAVLALGV